MIPSEVIRKVRKLEIATRRLVDRRIAGQYHSVFKGRGMDFDEVQPYAEGDDPRFIDWNVSARSDALHVKRFVEERELTVLVVVDMSASTAFGTAPQIKRDVAAELAAVLAFSAVRNNDRVGLVLFGADVELYIPPKKGRKHVLRVITRILGHPASARATDLGGALEFVRRIEKRKAVVFVVSDFLDEGWETSLKLAVRRHDVVPVVVEDPMERCLPSVDALIPVRDAETGEVAWLDLRSRAHRDAWLDLVGRARTDRTRTFHRLRLDAVEVDTSASWIEPLADFFRRRASRFR